MKSIKERQEFTARCLMSLVTAMADRNYKDANVIVKALAKEHGIKTVSP